MPAAATSRSSSQIQPNSNAPKPHGLRPRDLEPATSARLRSPTFFHLRHNDVSIVSARISPTYASSTPAGRCHLPLQPNCQRSSRSDRPQRPPNRQPVIGWSRTEHFSATPDDQRPVFPSPETENLTKSPDIVNSHYRQISLSDSPGHPPVPLPLPSSSLGGYCVRGHFRASQMVKTPEVKNRAFTL